MELITTDEMDVEYIQFKQLRVKGTLNLMPKTTTLNNLISIGKYGILLYLNDNFIHSIKTIDCAQSIILNNQDTKPTNWKIKSNIFHVSLDQETLLVGDIKKLDFIQLKDLTVQKSIVFEQKIIKILPNPESFPDQIAILTEDNCVHFVAISTGEKILVKSDPVTAFCWSVKGKQLCCGTKSGTIFQVTPQGDIKKQIARPEETAENSYIANILWLDNTVFFVVYQTDIEDKEAEIRVIVGGSKVYVVDEPTYSFSIDRPLHFFLQPFETNTPIRSMFTFIASTTSVDTGVIGTSEKNDWHNWCMEESLKVSMPIDSEDADTWPIGITIDYTSKVIVDEGTPDATPPCPMLWVLNNIGDLTAYYCVHKKAKSDDVFYQKMISSTTDLKISDIKSEQKNIEIQPKPDQNVTSAAEKSTMLGSPFGASKPGTSIFGSTAFKTNAGAATSLFGANQASTPLNQPSTFSFGALNKVDSKGTTAQAPAAFSFTKAANSTLSDNAETAKTTPTPLFGQSKVTPKLTAETAPAAKANEPIKNPIFASANSPAPKSLFGTNVVKTEATPSKIADSVVKKDTSSKSATKKSSAAPSLDSKSVKDTPAKKVSDIVPQLFSKKTASAAKPPSKQSPEQLLVDKFDSFYIELENDFKELSQFVETIGADISESLAKNLPKISAQRVTVEDLQGNIKGVHSHMSSVLEATEEVKSTIANMQDKQSECDSRMEYLSKPNSYPLAGCTNGLSPEAEQMKRKLLISKENVESSIEVLQRGVDKLDGRKQNRVTKDSTYIDIWNTTSLLRRSMKTTDQLLDGLATSILTYKKDHSLAPKDMQQEKKSERHRSGPFGLKKEDLYGDDSILLPPKANDIHLQKHLAKQKKLQLLKDRLKGRALIIEESNLSTRLETKQRIKEILSSVIGGTKEGEAIVEIDRSEQNIGSQDKGAVSETDIPALEESSFEQVEEGDFESDEELVNDTNTSDAANDVLSSEENFDSNVSEDGDEDENDESQENEYDAFLNDDMPVPKSEISFQPILASTPVLGAQKKLHDADQKSPMASFSFGTFGQTSKPKDGSLFNTSGTSIKVGEKSPSNTSGSSFGFTGFGAKPVASSTPVNQASSSIPVFKPSGFSFSSAAKTATNDDNKAIDTSKTPVKATGFGSGSAGFGSGSTGFGFGSTGFGLKQSTPSSPSKSTPNSFSGFKSNEGTGFSFSAAAKDNNVDTAKSTGAFGFGSKAFGTTNSPPKTIDTFSSNNTSKSTGFSFASAAKSVSDAKNTVTDETSKVLPEASTVSVSKPKTPDSPTKQIPTTFNYQAAGLSAKKLGWDCKNCLSKNDNMEASKCISCEVERDIENPVVDSSKASGIATIGSKTLVPGSPPKAPATFDFAKAGFSMKKTGWECTSCLSKNDNMDATKCVACEADREGVKTEAVKPKAIVEAPKPPASAAGFSFGSSGFGANATTSGSPPKAPATFDFAKAGFSMKKTGWDCTSCLSKNDNMDATKCVACEADREGVKTEAVKPKATVEAPKPPASAAGFSFGSSGFGTESVTAGTPVQGTNEDSKKEKNVFEAPKPPSSTEGFSFSKAGFGTTPTPTSLSSQLGSDNADGESAKIEAPKPPQGVLGFSFGSSSFSSNTNTSSTTQPTEAGTSKEIAEAPMDDDKDIDVDVMDDNENSSQMMAADDINTNMASMFGSKEVTNKVNPMFGSFSNTNNNVSTNAFGFNSQQPSSFVTPTKATSTIPTTFGSTPANVSQPSFGFGAGSSAFSQSTSAFGQTGFGATQAQKPVQSAFGQSSPSAFGTPQPANVQPAFGQSGFGQAANSSPSFGQSGFGNPSTPAFGQSGFGQSANATPAFGQSGFSQAAKASPAFGQSGFSQAANASPAFGQSGFGQAANPVFGQSSFAAAPQSSPAPIPAKTGFSSFANAPTGFATVAQSSSGTTGFGNVPQTNPNGNTFGNGGSVGKSQSFKPAFTGYR
ncbi:hypothetical protein BC833DRAFT_594460 [Globomyces pollinis-pini]|nr:hypothetical protein BC833DRAFT_594460 [Globomyces pollinis-pini]